MLLLLACLLALPVGTSSSSPPPSLIFVLCDDWGWANMGLHRDPSWPGNNETQTPNIDRLASNGLLLDRHYVFKYCSPTRSALQTGRNPVHVNVLNSPIAQSNRADPQAGFQGVARDFTGVAEKLAGVGYSTHQVGKWNAGMALERQSPAGRGYQVRPSVRPSHLRGRCRHPPRALTLRTPAPPHGPAPPLHPPSPTRAPCSTMTMTPSSGMAPLKSAASR